MKTQPLRTSMFIAGLGVILTLLLTWVSFEFVAQKEQVSMDEQVRTIVEEAHHRLDQIYEKLSYMMLSVHLSPHHKPPNMMLNEGDHAFYAPIVLDNDRRLFEAEVHESGLINFAIHRADQQDL